MAKSLTPEEIWKTVQEFESDNDDFSSGSDDVYVPSESSEAKVAASNTENDDEAELSDETADEINENENNRQIIKDKALIWNPPDQNFQPKRVPSATRECKLGLHIPRTSTALEIFHKLLPKSAFMYIAQCTNERIQIYENAQPKTKKVKITPTNAGEIKVIVGCMIIMSYSRVPSIRDYWSGHKSLGNRSIQESISRDRFTFITSKMYFAKPEKPSNCSKTYYLDDLVTCLKKNFQKCRQDSPYQSIDESMTKFKGRSTLKQYMPLKPVKRGIKMWLRCDASTGYAYDFNIYSGKELELAVGTLGERVVNKLASSIIEPDVTLCFDRFFTSVHLLDTIVYSAVGTVMGNRKNLPVFDKKKMLRGEAVFMSSLSGLLCVKWQDTKEVLVLSNCHKPAMTLVTKTLKTGEKIEVECPEQIKFYREIMGGVDLADQMSGLYEYDRKSDKWWKKVFTRLLMMAAVNAWIIHSELNRNKVPFKNFLVTLAEALIEEGLKTTAVRRSMKPGRRSQQPQATNHLPIEGNTRRRCTNCSRFKKQTRTKTICRECNIPLCKICFAAYHS